MKKLKDIFVFYALIPFAASIPVLILNLFAAQVWVNVPGVPVIVLLLLRFFLRKNPDYKAGAGIYGVALLFLFLVFTAMMAISKGNVDGVLMLNFCWLIFPFAPIMLLPVLMGKTFVVYLTAFFSYLAGWVFCAQKAGGFHLRRLALPSACILLCFGISTGYYLNRPSVKYGGHGFSYMNGYSSTDFTDYTVYAQNSRLAALDHEASFRIENEADMPVLDGAEACYPLYASLAKAVYKNIDAIEQQALSMEDCRYSGKIVTFSNTVVGFERLVLKTDVFEKRGEGIDLFFGARPSADQMQIAKEFGSEPEITPIGKEAFVFFVEADNPINELTSEEIRGIYRGDINSWADLGGKNEKIIAFQRPNNSGSQTMMTYFMGESALKAPKTYETVDAMGGVIQRVAQYANEEGAIGYTFRYFLEELNQEKGVKMLAVDGVYPTLESIEDGSYPLTVDLCVISRKDDPNPNVKAMIDFILSEDGQELVKKTGYAPLYG